MSPSAESLFRSRRQMSSLLSVVRKLLLNDKKDGTTGPFPGIGGVVSSLYWGFDYSMRPIRGGVKIR